MGIFGGPDKLNQDGRLPPPENDPPKKVVPVRQGTAWSVVMAGTEDVRCSFRAVHLHAVFHALGINPDTPWPPSPEVELALREAGVPTVKA